jgi:hypothetical protein
MKKQLSKRPEIQASVETNRSIKEINNKQRNFNKEIILRVSENSSIYRTPEQPFTSNNFR